MAFFQLRPTNTSTTPPSTNTGVTPEAAICSSVPSSGLLLLGEEASTLLLPAILPRSRA